VKRPIYLDHHATTPVDRRVLEAMLPYFREEYGNAASRSHVFGWNAESAVEAARESIAAALNARPREILFTSGATESNNLAIKGALEAAGRRAHVVTTAIEHRSVLDVCRRLERERRVALTVLPSDCQGRVSPDAVREALTPETLLVSVMAANNEVGTLQPLAEIGRICKDAGVLFHTDAAQAVGRLPIDVEAMGIDLLTCSAHKLYGPKGVGCLFVRSKNPRVRLAAMLDGGGHERGLRSGTLNVPGIVGLARAIEISLRERVEEEARVRSLRDRLHEGIVSRLDGVRQNGHPVERLAGNLNLSFERVDGESLLTGLREIAVSSGSACTSASTEPSHVLRALGVPDDLAHASLRFGIGRFTTADEIDYVAARVVEVVLRLRSQRADTESGSDVADSQSGSRPAGGHPEMTEMNDPIDHQANPRNLGSFAKDEPNIFTGIVGAAECGDVMKLQLKVDERGVIVDARFKTFGCGSAIASSSLATEWVKGKTLDQALLINKTDLLEELALPPVKIHCSALAEDAIKAAVEDYRRKHKTGGGGATTAEVSVRK
jgi:cysteine desulfurase